MKKKRKKGSANEATRQHNSSFSFLDLISNGTIFFKVSKQGGLRKSLFIENS